MKKVDRLNYDRGPSNLTKGLTSKDSLYKHPDYVMLNSLAIGGDESAFSNLTAIAVPYLVRHFNYKARNLELAKELTQDTLERVLKSREQFKEGSFAAWLFFIAGNIYIDHYRKVKKNPSTDLFDSYPDDFSEKPEDVIERIDREQKLQMLHEGMEELTDQQKQVLEAWLNGKKVNTIASDTDTKRVNVRALLHRSRVNLKKFVTRNEVNESEPKTKRKRG